MVLLISLSSLISVSDVAAESLGKFEGALYLGGLTSLSDAATEALAKSVYPILTGDDIKLILEETKKLTYS